MIKNNKDANIQLLSIQKKYLARKNRFKFGNKKEDSWNMPEFSENRLFSSFII